jgi:hypothetical protein
MIVIGRWRSQRFPATRALNSPATSHRGNPVTSVHPANVNHHVRLHGTGVVTARAAPKHTVRSRMCLEAVLVQPTLLEKSLSTSGLRTDIVQRPGVFLDMIEHRVFPCLGFATVRTYIESRGILDILGSSSRSRHSRIRRSNRSNRSNRGHRMRLVTLR